MDATTYQQRGRGRGFGGEAAGRRRYRTNTGRACEDCGWRHKPLTLVHFWIGGGPYYFCSECIRPYRRVICHPDPEWRK